MATQYKDFLLDPQTGDFSFGTADKKEMVIVTSNQMSLRQRLYMRFGVWAGDWYFDEAFGFPYRTFIAKKTVKAVLDGRIKSEVRQEPDVLEITDFQSSMNVNSRTYECYFTVVTAEGEEINLAFIGADQFQYPTPPESNVSLCGDEGAIITFKNKLYYLINFQLPKYGDSTWVNTWK